MPDNHSAKIKKASNSITQNLLVLSLTYMHTHMRPCLDLNANIYKSKLHLELYCLDKESEEKQRYILLRCLCRGPIHDDLKHSCVPVSCTTELGMLP